MLGAVHFFLTYILFFRVCTPSLAFFRAQPPNYPHGQVQANILRHTVAVSSLPSQFGKQGSMLLSRHVASTDRIWASAHPFIRTVLSNPQKLDWWIADVNTDARQTVTINAAFSCLDVGQSTARPLTWWATPYAEELRYLGNYSTKYGHAEIMNPENVSMSSVNDMTMQCLDRRTSVNKYRIVEIPNLHQGNGHFLKIPTHTPSSLMDNPQAFDEILRARNKHPQSTPTVFYRGIPIVVGIPYDTGFRLKTPDNFTTNFQRSLTAPITVVAALTKHIGARIEESRVAEAKAPTDLKILLLTVLEAGLPLLLAVYWIAKNYADTVIHRSEAVRKLDVHEAVWHTDGWTIHEKGMMVFNIAAAAILFAPFALAIIEGKVNSRINVEITSGVSVFYGSSHKQMSVDRLNYVAGAPFVVSCWISVRKLGPGFSVALILALLSIFLAATQIVLKEVKRSELLMAASSVAGAGFSLIKLFYTLKLKLFHSSKTARVKDFRVTINLFPDSVNEQGMRYMEDRKKEILLLGNYRFRECARKFYWGQKSRDIAQAIRTAARESAAQQLRTKQGDRVSLECCVRLSDYWRYQALMCKTVLWSKHMPRGWEHVRRERVFKSYEGQTIESLEYYRASGEYPPDISTIILRLGLIDYLQYVQSIELEPMSDGKRLLDYDGDEVKTVVRVHGDKQTSVSSDDVEHQDISDMLPQVEGKRVTSLMIKWEEGALAHPSVTYPSGHEYICYRQGNE